MSEQLLTTHEAQKVLKIGRNGLFKLIHEDPTFPAVRIGDKKLIIVGSQLDVLAKNKLLGQEGKR